MPGGSCPCTGSRPGLTAARLRSAIRDALDRAGPTYPEYLPAAIRAEMALPGISADARVRPLPADLRGPRRRPPPARLRRAPGAPARAWSPGAASAARAAAVPIAIDDASDARRPGGPHRRAGGPGRARGEPDRRPGRRHGADPDGHRAARPRCCGSSRATSARARPRSRPTRSRPSRGPGSRGRCWPRPTCSPGSTSRPSGRCWRSLGIGVTLLTGSLKADRRREGARRHRVRAGRGGRRDPCAHPGVRVVRATSASWSSTSSIASGSASATRSKARRADARRTSC